MRWKPHGTHKAEGIKTGPSTRRYVGPRDTGMSLQILELLQKETLAKWATRLGRIDPRGGITVSYDADRKLYITHDGEDHAIAHSRRLSKLFHGHHSRGRRLVYEYLLDRVAFEDGDWIIDVGANTGDLCLAFRALEKKVNIEAFEPAPGEYAALSANLATSSSVINFRAHQLALWNERSEGLTFYMKSGSADSSLLPIEDADDIVTVPSARLDDLFAGDTRRFKLLKLEAEGVEPEILEGAESLLPRIDYIAADVGFERGSEQESTLPQVANFLVERGFEIVGFEYGRLTLLFRNKFHP